MAQAKLPNVQLEISGDMILLTKDAVITVGVSRHTTVEERIRIKDEISAQFPADTKIFIYNKDLIDIRVIIPVIEESAPQ